MVYPIHPAAVHPSAQSEIQSAAAQSDGEPSVWSRVGSAVADQLQQRADIFQQNIRSLVTGNWGRLPFIGAVLTCLPRITEACIPAPPHDSPFYNDCCNNEGNIYNSCPDSFLDYIQQNDPTLWGVICAEADRHLSAPICANIAAQTTTTTLAPGGYTLGVPTTESSGNHGVAEGYKTGTIVGATVAGVLLLAFLAKCYTARGASRIIEAQKAGVDRELKALQLEVNAGIALYTKQLADPAYTGDQAQLAGDVIQLGTWSQNVGSLVMTPGDKRDRAFVVSSTQYIQSIKGDAVFERMQTAIHDDEVAQRVAIQMAAPQHPPQQQQLAQPIVRQERLVARSSRQGLTEPALWRERGQLITSLSIDPSRLPRPTEIDALEQQVIDLRQQLAESSV